ncbi:HNH endonuclease [Candidatus Pacearchaeota archaeon]|nr:HNH endonuclease [Candidatus Pacearchaeota archaeon]
MKKHTRIYFDFFNVDYDPISGWHNCVSEISGNRANDIHHIESRGMGGSKRSDNIENLMALTREEHIKLGDKKQYLVYLKQLHAAYIKRFTKNKP